MVKKLTIKTWISTGLVILFCLAFAVPMLWMNLPTALAALSGKPVVLDEKDSMTNVYGITILGLVFALFALFIFIKQLNNSVKKDIRKFLTAHPQVTWEQMETDFAAAEQVGNVWIGRRFTFSHSLHGVVMENDEIVWVYSESERFKNNITYYLCLGMASGKVERAAVKEKLLLRMKELYEHFPHILVGNNPEYGYQFKHDLEGFLAIRYRQGEM